MWSLLFAASLIAQALTFGEALRQAQALPTVQAGERAQKARAELAEHTSQLLDNPLLQVQPGGRHMANRGAGPEVYVTLTQRFNLSSAGKKRQNSLRREVAHDAALVGLSLREARQSIAAAWLRHWIADRVRDVSQREVALADELLRSIEATFEAGEATQVDVSAARAWKAEATLSALSMEGESFESGVMLGRAVGADDGQPRDLTGPLPGIELPSEASLQARVGQVDDTVQVHEARAAQQAELARLSEIEATKGPNFGVGAMAWREGGGDFAAVAMLEVQLPVFDRGERERAVQAAIAERASGKLDDSVIGQRAERVRLLHDLEHTHAVAQALDTQLLRAAHELADAQQKRFQAREATAQDWVIARRNLLSADVQLIKARAAEVLARFLVAESFTAKSKP